MKTLTDLLHEQLKDLLSAEMQLTKALPKLEAASSSAALKKAFKAHNKETETHVERLEKIGKLLGTSLKGKTCKAMEGLIKEGDEARKSDCEFEPLRDVLLVAAAQRVEHYEIAGYGNARALSSYLGLGKVTELLEETIDEEGATDKKLTEICERELFDAASDGALNTKKPRESAKRKPQAPRPSAAQLR